MAAIKISSKVDEHVWKELRDLAEETHQSILAFLRKPSGTMFAVTGFGQRSCATSKIQ